jgi:myo-inositol 2-dehydrogenase/D-chiro-inositol 1-dehydrogenase
MDPRPTSPSAPSSSFPDLTRRDFVRSSVATGLGVGLGSGLIGLSSARAADARARRGSDQIKIALIGCGGRGTGAAIQALNADPGVTLWSMSDVFGERLDSSLKGINETMGDQASARVQVPPERRFTGFDSYKPAIDAGVDAVLITGYPAFRPTHYRYAIEKNKHVFAEKPVAVDGPGVRSFIETAKQAKAKNLATLVGYCWRYHDGMVATFDKVNSGAIGQIMSVHTTYHTGTLSKRPASPSGAISSSRCATGGTSRGSPATTSSSRPCTPSTAAHGPSAIASPSASTASAGARPAPGPEPGNVFDHFAAIYEYEGGRAPFHTCRQIDGCPSDNTDYIYGTKGSATVNGWIPTFETRDLDNKRTWQYDGRADRDMYQTEHEELFKSIRAGAPINDALRGSNSTLMAIMARMSAYTGQTVSWEQALNSKESLVPDTLAWGPMPMPQVAIPGQTKLV